MIDNGEADAFLGAAFQDSKLPARKFCCVCGFLAPYKCAKCLQCFCSLKCDETHKVKFLYIFKKIFFDFYILILVSQEMRCLKFTR